MHGDCRLLRPRKTQYNTNKKTFAYSEKPEKERAKFAARLKRVPKDKRIYVDECGITTHSQREYARAPRGKIIEETKPGEKLDRVNAIGALCKGEYSAIECYRHTTDSAFFEGWFENNLLKEFPKGYTVIMDNARFHSKERPRKLARERRVYCSCRHTRRTITR